ncbi:MAG: response regulator [Chitinispirillaceae bacterium]|nr:response regulator [Chitinispirillaceae bacterium]
MGTQQKKVLIVEDDQMNASLIAAVLEERGYNVLTAGDGDVGLEILAKDQEIAGVVTDIFMPNREGIGFIRAVKSRHAAVRIAAMTGAVNYESIFSTAQDFGADYTIKKPFDIDEFADKIDEMLRN